MLPSARWCALSVMCVAVVGCGDPGPMVPVAPPGVELVRMPPIPEGEGAQALGEQAASTAGADPNAPKPETQIPEAPSTKVGETAGNAAGLSYTTLKEGNGPTAKGGMTATVHYTGTLDNGTVFDSSVGKQPFSFKIGNNSVIKGWDMGVPGMKIGEKRKLIIPAALGYGSRPQGSIPADSNLTFEIELLKVE